MVNTMKIKACRKLVKIASAIIGSGRRNGSRTKNTAMINSPVNVGEETDRQGKGRAKWLMISIGIIKNDSHQTGPANCLKYFKPCFLIPK
jgi:hypothetical protein